MCVSNFAMIKATQKNMMNILTTALTLVEGLYKNNRVDEEDLDNFGVSFPMKIMAEFENIEELLNTNKQFANYLVMHSIFEFVSINGYF